MSVDHFKYDQPQNLMGPLHNSSPKSTGFHENRLKTFHTFLLMEKQTKKQRDKWTDGWRWWHNLVGGGNYKYL